MTSPALREIQSIAIVGAGLGGLTVANALANKGFDVHVYEQAAAIERVGAGIQLGPNATAVLKPLGLLDQLIEDGCTPRLSRGFDASTGEVISEAPLGGGAYNTPYLQAHRADVHSALLAAVPSADVHLDKRLTRLDETDDGVLLEFADQSTAEADFVIGADGIHSMVQQHLFGELPLTFSGWASHRGIVNSKDIEDLDIEVIAGKWLGPDRHFVHYYVSGGKQLTFIAVLPQENATPESWTRESDKDEVLAALSDFHPKVRELVRRADRIQKWAIYDRNTLLTWSRGRITLMGDACHPMRPFMAQGGGSAMEDAAVLARAVTELPSSISLLDALGVYEATRKPRTAWMQAASVTHALRQSSYPDSPSPNEYIYSYDAFGDPLTIPPRIRALI